MGRFPNNGAAGIHRATLQDFSFHDRLTGAEKHVRRGLLGAHFSAVPMGQGDRDHHRPESTGTCVAQPLWPPASPTDRASRPRPRPRSPVTSGLRT